MSFTIIISPCSLHNIAMALKIQQNTVAIMLVNVFICLAFAVL